MTVEYKGYHTFIIFKLGLKKSRKERQKNKRRYIKRRKKSII